MERPLSPKVAPSKGRRKRVSQSEGRERSSFQSAYLTKSLDFTPAQASGNKPLTFGRLNYRSARQGEGLLAR